jgi:hypothetical protein
VISTRVGKHFASSGGVAALAASCIRPDRRSARTRSTPTSTAPPRAEGKRQDHPNGQVLAGFKSLCLNDDIVVPPMAHPPRPG